MGVALYIYELLPYPSLAGSTKAYKKQATSQLTRHPRHAGEQKQDNKANEQSNKHDATTDATTRQRIGDLPGVGPDRPRVRSRGIQPRLGSHGDA